VTRVAYKDTIIDDLLVGSIDLHVHVGPDPSHRAGGTRRYDVAQVGEMAKAAGQPAVGFHIVMNREGKFFS